MPNANTILLADAVKWVNRWRALSPQVINKKGFFIPKVDLTEVLAEHDVENVRSYLAIDDEGEFHLLIVGVDAAGDDMLDPDKGQYVYDFTQPCPATCSSTGVLK